MLNTRSLLYRLALVLPMLTGCSSQDYFSSPASLSDIEQVENEERQADEKLIATLEKLRANPGVPDLSENMFRRQMSLTYSGSVKHLTDHHRKVIKLFFQTMPDSNNISIILSVAPSSSRETFEGLNDAWVRVQELRHYLKDYSGQIQELYIPDQAPDTITIQVLGGDSV